MSAHDIHMTRRPMALARLAAFLGIHASRSEARRASVVTRLHKVGIAALAISFGPAVASQAESDAARFGAAPPTGCLVTVAGAPGYLPRAHLEVENRRAASMWLRLEARTGSGLPEIDLGQIGPSERRVFAHTLPAGRNILVAVTAGEQGATLRYVLQVNNRGPETCVRRYLWRVQ